MFCRRVLKGRWLSLLVVALALAGCSGTPQKIKPTELGPNPGLLGVRLAWSAQIGTVDFPLDIKVNGEQITLADGDGAVAQLDARTGAAIWRGNAQSPVGAGVGNDGRLAAVLTRGNELVAMASGRELWRQQVSAQGFTAPLVAGGRVFLLTADRGVSAFDAATGRKLWSQQRPGDALVLRQSGVLLAVNDTLVVGLGGRLTGLNPANGSIRWEAPLASPRGTNDVERLVDLVGPVSRDGDVVCARAFQAAVGCVNAARGSLMWTRSASGAVGLHGDSRSVFGVEGDGRVLAWRRSDGQPAWTSDQLRYRDLSAPLAVGRAVAVGDGAGWVHWLSREDGALLTRMPTDGSAVVSAPVLAGGTVVVVTRRGGVFGFRPD